MTEIAACPFCKEKPSIYININLEIDDMSFRIECQECENVKSDRYVSRDFAVNAWNKCKEI